MPEQAAEVVSARASEVFVAGCDPVLIEFLCADTEHKAKERLDYIHHEFIAPLVTATLSFELRRGPSSTWAQMRVEDESFREIQVITEGKIAKRLLRMRDDYLHG